MIIKELKETKVEEITDVICDICGCSCKKEVKNFEGKIIPVYDYMEINKKWGYYSDKDLEKWSAQICEKCVDEKLSFIKFKKEFYKL